jgi:hypothetical protein
MPTGAVPVPGGYRGVAQGGLAGTTGPVAGGMAEGSDIGALPAVRWPGPGEIDVVAEIPPAGVFLGMDRAGWPVMLPAIQPRAVRVGMLGAPAVAAVLAYRLLAVGCQVTVFTVGSTYWNSLYDKISSDRLMLFDRPLGWPLASAGPPGSSHGPQALILDHPTPPPRWLGQSPWCIVVHAATASPAGSEFWANVDAMLLTSPGYGAAAAQRWQRADAASADDLRPGEIALADRDGTRPLAFPLTPAEREIVG